MPLCRYFTAVLKCKADIIPGVDRYEVNQSAPKVHIEFLYQAVLCRQGFQEGFYFCLSSLLVGDGCGDLIVPSLGSIVANMLWLMFISYALMPDEHSVKMGEAVLYGKSLKKDFVKKYVLRDANPISEEDAANKREYVKDSQDGMLQLIRLLKQSDTYSDLADYYLAMRYAIGMVANDYSDDLNKTIGMEMLTAYASLGNQYVLNYFRAVRGI